MRYGLRQCRAQTFAFAHGLGLSKLFNGAGALDGNGDQSADGFERLARKSRTGNSQAADRTHTQANRNEAEAVGNVDDRLFASNDSFETVDIEARNHRPRAIDFLFLGKQQCRGAHLKCIYNLGGNSVEQLNYVAGFEQNLTEGV